MFRQTFNLSAFPALNVKLSLSSPTTPPQILQLNVNKFFRFATGTVASNLSDRKEQEMWTQAKEASAIT
jgi:hypothetical protein